MEYIMRLTKHAAGQMAERKISSNQVAEAIKMGHVMINKNKRTNRTIIDNTQGLYVVTDITLTIVITAFWRN